VQERLEQFIEFLEVERQASPNTVEAYRRDCSQFILFLMKERGRTQLEDSTEDDLLVYLENLHRQRMARSTVSRKLSAIRTFYRSMLRDGLPVPDITAAVESRRGDKRIPESLSQAEVEALLAQPDVRTCTGLRDAAMLTTLYATGLRVSELLHLKLGDINLDSGAVRCVGKGDRERIIPMAQAACALVRRYLLEARPKLARRHQEPRKPSCHPPFLRDTSSRRRRRPEGHPGDARPRGHLHHANLHPRLPQASAGGLRRQVPAGMSLYQILRA